MPINIQYGVDELLGLARAAGQAQGNAALQESMRQEALRRQMAQDEMLLRQMGLAQAQDQNAIQNALAAGRVQQDESQFSRRLSLQESERRLERQQQDDQFAAGLPLRERHAAAAEKTAAAAEKTAAQGYGFKEERNPLELAKAKQDLEQRARAEALRDNQTQVAALRQQLEDMVVDGYDRKSGTPHTYLEQGVVMEGMKDQYGEVYERWRKATDKGASLYLDMAAPPKTVPQPTSRPSASTQPAAAQPQGNEPRPGLVTHIARPPWRSAPLSPDLARQYLDLAGGDKAKARELAKADGWSTKGSGG